ncbi:MAG: O-methyltransferase [Thermoanaerobaculia bacterium]
MKRPSPILRPTQARYIDSLRPLRDVLVAEMEKYALDNDVPIAMPELGRLLEALAASKPAGRCLEIGSAIGYGTLRLARGAREGRVVSIERDGARLAIAREYLATGGVLPRVDFLQGEALEVLRGVQGPFDLVYIDGDKRDYRRALDLTLPMVNVGGYVVVDNLLWHGSIADPKLRAENDESAREIERFNPYFMIHPQLATVLLPLGDGVGLGVKRRQTIRELGGPF